MTNGEKYKTAEERAEAYSKTQDVQRGRGFVSPILAFAWLELEAAEEKPLPCPFCGGECEVGLGRVFCKTQSCYCSKSFDMNEKAIAAHNRVARAVMAAKEKEAE